MQICIAVHEHKHGSATRAFESDEGALQWRTEIAKDNWELEFPGKEVPGDDLIADEYFVQNFLIEDRPISSEEDHRISLV